MAGSKMSLTDNDGAFYRDSKNKFPATFTDGTSNTVLFVELLRGDGGKKAVTVQRQHVRLKAAALKRLKEGDGVKDFEDGKNIASDRGSAWIDGRFLRATTNATLRHDGRAARRGLRRRGRAGRRPHAGRRDQPRHRGRLRPLDHAATQPRHLEGRLHDERRRSPRPDW